MPGDFMGLSLRRGDEVRLQHACGWKKGMVRFRLGMGTLAPGRCGVWGAAGLRRRCVNKRNYDSIKPGVGSLVSAFGTSFTAPALVMGRDSKGHFATRVSTPMSERS